MHSTTTSLAAPARGGADHLDQAPTRVGVDPDLDGRADLLVLDRAERLAGRIPGRRGAPGRGRTRPPSRGPTAGRAARRRGSPTRWSPRRRRGRGRRAGAGTCRPSTRHRRAAPRRAGLAVGGGRACAPREASCRSADAASSAPNSPPQRSPFPPATPLPYSRRNPSAPWSAVRLQAGCAKADVGRNVALACRSPPRRHRDTTASSRPSATSTTPTCRGRRSRRSATPTARCPTSGRSGSPSRPTRRT